MSKLNIGIAGVGGRMGVMILKDILGREATTVASGLVRTGSNLVGSAVSYTHLRAHET